MILRSEFPILEKNSETIYLDSACTSLKPKKVIEAETSYYTDFGACGSRSSHRLGRKTSEMVDECRENVASFVFAKSDQLIWTRNTTEGLNIVANGIDYSAKRRVVTTIMEHHSVLLPFMKLRDSGIIDLEILKCNEKEEIELSAWEESIDKRTSLVVTNSWNNTTGTGNDVKKIAKIAQDNSALICIDGAQGVPHHKLDFKNCNIDFLCFSGHKMLGPTGIGALVCKQESMDRIKPLMVGGGTVKKVGLEKIIFENGYARFEAGIQNYSGIFGFSAACDYLKEISMEKVEAHGKRISDEMKVQLENADAIIYGSDKIDHGALYSFNLKGAKPHDLALLMDKENIALRSGFFCAQPAMEHLGAKEGAVRISSYIYNTTEEIRKFGEKLSKMRKLY